jgi:hypothetical protein
MLRGLVALLVGAALCSAGFLPAADQKQGNQPMQRGIDGKIKSVDVAGKTLTITTPAGDRTFTITDNTVLAGPRGGKVPRHLKDPRFHEGFPVTVVAQGTTATEVHLGFARGGAEEPAAQTNTTPPTAQPRGMPTLRKPAANEPVNPPTADQTSRTSKYPTQPNKDTEIAARIKTFDPAKRILVVSLPNGQDRSFMLPNNVAVMVRGAASRQGLQDPAMRVGARITIMTDENGHKVKSIEIIPARLRRAG